MKSSKCQYTNKCKSFTSTNISYFCHCKQYDHVSKNLTIAVAVSAAADIQLYTGFQKVKQNCKRFSLNISVHNFDRCHTSSHLYMKF